jgi:spermidine/putrescine transport system permease protein
MQPHPGIRPLPSRPAAARGLGGVQRACGCWTAGVLLFLYLPIALLVVYSFNASRLNIRWEGFTWKWYGELWRHEPLLRALTNSLIVATPATALSVLLGVTGAWALRRHRFPLARLVNGLVYVPLILPEIILGISLLVFFASVKFPLGFGSVVIAHTTFCFPFVLLAVQARLAGLDPHLEEAALDLGATPLRAFWHVIVPALMPAIVAGALMAFTLSLDELIVTYFTASPASATLPLKIFGLARVGLNPMLNAISAVFIVTTAALVVLAEYLKRMNRTDASAS